MDNEKIKSLIEQLKAFLDEEKIMDVFYEAFKEGKMDRKDLESLAEAMGYELTDEFKEEEHSDPIEEGGAEAGVDNLSKEDLEEAKEIKPGESKEEFKEKIDEMSEDIEKPAEGEEKSEEKSEEDAEWEEAQKLFK